ncbi:DNA-binding FadR family transcriptional regulator [Kibdelosporangium banguiense]|uniref:DNA-binding FadR family transcriptional regulator n=1 Tax=Kibdelosporangium banguiense TaxID=1365924 RepID=A0ABS4TBX1_9PSEU|nr:FCD domain-containing protein [Kibdelosporangium banguiense]MBP2321829.1 DNA-binding FadR family transcriptional regulator [Kibdelosporangium banguiense]
MTSARTLHAHLLDSLGLALTSGQYPSGTVLRLDELTAKYGVSRTVGREAVRVLEALRMVRSRPKIGMIVLPVAEWNLFDPQLIRWRLAGADRRELLKQLSQLRAAVEPAAAGLAATAATTEQCTELLRLADLMRKQAVAGDLPGFVDADVAFHRLVFLASGNGLFVQVGEVTGQVLHGRAELPDLRATALDWHAQVAEAVAAGNSGEAERVSRCIVLDTAAELDRMLET